MKTQKHKHSKQETKDLFTPDPQTLLVNSNNTPKPDNNNNNQPQPRINETQYNSEVDLSIFFILPKIQHSNHYDRF
jgi:hypothetical protein